MTQDTHNDDSGRTERFKSSAKAMGIWLVATLLVLSVLSPAVALIGTQPAAQEQAGVVQAQTGWTLDWSNDGRGEIVDLDTHQSDGYVHAHHSGSPFQSYGFDGTLVGDYSASGGDPALGDFAEGYGFGVYTNGYTGVLQAYGSASWNASTLSDYHDADVRPSDGYSYALGGDGIAIYDRSGAEVASTQTDQAPTGTNRMAVFEDAGLVVASTPAGVEVYDLSLTHQFTYGQSGVTDVDYHNGDIYAVTDTGELLRIDGDGTLVYNENVASALEEIAVAENGKVYVGQDGSGTIDVAYTANGTVTASKTGDWGAVYSLDTYVDGGTVHVVVGDGGSDGTAFYNVWAYDTTEAEVSPTPSPTPTTTPTPTATEKELTIDTRSLFKPNSTHPYTIYLDGEGDVTDNATLTSSNSTLLAVNSSGHTLTSINDTNVSAVVTLNASYTDANGTQYTATKDVVIAEATVENLAILPGGTWRTSAVIGDGFFQALLVALFMGVAMTRFTSAFGGLAAGEMVLVVGWFAGYVSWAMAAVSLFVALFIGLNLAANIDYTVRR